MEVLPDQAVSFALLLTELVTNAAKHAYGPQGGTVHVDLTDENGKRLLQVRDEGEGLAPEFSIEGAGKSSLGMSLIKALTQTLGGEIELVPGRGATFQVRF